MPNMFDSVAADSVAASASGTAGLQPSLVLVIIGAVLLSSFLRAASRKRRARQGNPTTQANPGRPVPHPSSPVPHPSGKVPFSGTLLNGVPMRSYDSSPVHQGISFSNERMKAEAELKRQLDALDTARRNGQVTAEQYAVHREGIFKNF